MLTLELGDGTYLRDVSATADPNAFADTADIEWVPVVAPPLTTSDARVSQAMLFHMPRHATSCMILHDRELVDIRGQRGEIFVSPTNIGTLYHGLPHNLLGKFSAYTPPTGGPPKLGVVALTADDIATVALYYQHLYDSQIREELPPPPPDATL